MFNYYLKLGWLSLRNNPMLSLLMVAAIGVGIGAFMTILTVNYTMSGNPIPQKSDQLFHVQLDSWDANDPGDDGFEPPDQVTYRDSMAMMRGAPAPRKIVSNRSALVLEPEGDEEIPFTVDVRNTWADFFPMFEPPFLYGGGWDDTADLNSEPVVVLGRELNEQVFGGEDSVGRTVRMNGMDFRVVGVLDEWLLVPKFYDVTNGPFDETEEAFIPFNLAIQQEFPRNGNTNCWKAPEGDGMEAFRNSECVWMQYWVELESDAQKAEFTSWLDAYVMEQKVLGRFPRPLNNQVLNVTEWLENQQVVDDDAQLMLGLSFLFLLVCLLNTIGLLLAKFMKKTGDISVRRALGARRSDLFMQHMVEAGLIGLAGGILGLFLTWLGLEGIKVLFGDLVENLISFDWVMMLTAIAMAIIAAIIAGLYPTWRATQVMPASQLKTQ